MFSSICEWAQIRSYTSPYWGSNPPFDTAREGEREKEKRKVSPIKGYGVLKGVSCKGKHEVRQERKVEPKVHWTL